MVDRFEVIRLVTYEGSEEREHLQSVEQIDARVRRAQNFAWQSRKATLVNGRQSIEALTQSCDPFVREVLIPQLRGSKRRARALLRVARTLADMEEILRSRFFIATDHDVIDDVKQTLRVFATQGLLQQIAS